MKFSWQSAIFLIFGLLVGASATWLITKNLTGKSTDLISPFVKQETTASKPLQQYSIPSLMERRYAVSPPLKIAQLVATSSEVEFIFLPFKPWIKPCLGW